MENSNCFLENYDDDGRFRQDLYDDALYLSGSVITIDMVVWEDYEAGSNIVSVDISHWNADQMQRFWEFIHAN